mmetsp:Transcript_38912/g.93613  ORF Transcript_38912/g.93613 Transcript_38912/m.93613 type:complete len:214 (+) Transcript_38912:398-1039(+)
MTARRGGTATTVLPTRPRNGDEASRCRGRRRARRRCSHGIIAIIGHGRDLRDAITSSSAGTSDDGIDDDRLRPRNHPPPAAPARAEIAVPPPRPRAPPSRRPLPRRGEERGGGQLDLPWSRILMMALQAMMGMKTGGRESPRRKRPRVWRRRRRSGTRRSMPGPGTSSSRNPLLLRPRFKRRLRRRHHHRPRDPMMALRSPLWERRETTTRRR